MKAWVVLAALAACGPGLKVEDPKVAGADALAQASGNEQGIRALLNGAVSYAGLWFTDPACTAQFPATAVIPPARFDAFAHCLAELHWHASPRTDPLDDVVVLTYPPGIEIEARMDPELSGPRLSWIGFVSRRDEPASLPSVTPAVFDALRTAGDRDGPLDPAIARTLELDPDTHHASAWFQICLDASGKVTGTHLRKMSSPHAAHAFADAAAHWKFQPFTVAGHALPVCSLVRMAYPPDRTASADDRRLPLPLPPSASRELPDDAPAEVPHREIDAHRISGFTAVEPDDATKRAIYKRGNPEVSGTYMICLNRAGHIESLAILHSTGYASYDREIAVAMRSWVYAPFVVDGKPSPVCTEVTYYYNQ